MEYVIIQKVQTSQNKILWMLDFWTDEKEIILISNLLKSETSKIKAMKIFYQLKNAWLFGRRKIRNSTKTINYRYNELTKRVPQEIMKILMTKCWEKWTIKQLFSTFNLILYEELLSNESKFIKRQRRKEIIKYKLPYNILNDHIKYAEII